MRLGAITQNVPISADLVIPKGEYQALRNFLRERSNDGREAAAYLLCGIHRCRGRYRLLTRSLLLPDDECFERRSTGSIAVKAVFDQWMLERADAEGLALVQTHTHPHSGQPTFSSIDDHAEHRRAESLHRLTKRPLGSVVFDKEAQHLASRLWVMREKRVQAIPLRILLGTPSEPGALAPDAEAATDARFDRQVRAFGGALQGRLKALRVGVVGVGGLGGLIVEGLARLGVERLVLIDPDRVETSNLNRLPGATLRDAQLGTLKTDVAKRNVRAVHGSRARARSLAEPIPHERALHALVGCDVLVCATDNHASRLWTMELASAYLRPIVNAGVGLTALGGTITSIGARVSSVPVGGPWCLVCGGQIDPFAAARELASGRERELLKLSGYLEDTPAPAVYWVNACAASEAIRQIHALVMPFQEAASGVDGTDVFIDLLTRESFVIDHGSTGRSCLTCGSDGCRGLGRSYHRAESNSELPELECENDDRVASIGVGPVLEKCEDQDTASIPAEGIQSGPIKT